MTTTAAALAVYGEALVDAFSSGPVPGGAPFNVARHLAGLGRAPLMLTAIGADAAGAAIDAEFTRWALRREGLQVRPDRPTGVVQVHEDDPGTHTFRIGGPCAWDDIGDAAALAVAEHAAPDAWLCHGSLALRGDVSRHTWRQVAALHGGPVLMDLNWRDGQIDRAVAAEALAAADVLKVNDAEHAMLAAWLAAPPPVPDAPDDAAIAAIAAHYDLRHVIVTHGERGASAYDATGRRTAAAHAPALERVVDTVGAGDAFCAVLLCGFVDHWPLDVALSRACRYASRVCTVRGAVPEDPAWMAPTLAEWSAAA